MGVLMCDPNGSLGSHLVRIPSRIQQWEVPTSNGARPEVVNNTREKVDGTVTILVLLYRNPSIPCTLTMDHLTTISTLDDWGWRKKQKTQTPTWLALAIHVIMHKTFVAKEIVIPSTLCSKVFYHLNISSTWMHCANVFTFKNWYIQFSMDSWPSEWYQNRSHPPLEPSLMPISSSISSRGFVLRSPSEISGDQVVVIEIAAVSRTYY